MSITELILKAGEANVKVQNVATDLASMKRNKNCSIISIATSHEMGSAISREAAGIPATHYGLLVWIPHEVPPAPQLPSVP